ncbi:sensor histidine kinase [Ligilactobacillus ruminis]|uniref:sensor histidine kinase n=1 Tax=Ligilactobacillus ruminis TaxID=1623 RepID=UPI003B9C051F
MSDRYFVHIAPLVILFLVTQGVFLIILFNFELSRHDELNRQKMQQSEINSLMEYTEKLEREERRLRKFKHDSQNMLLSLRELADFEDRNAFKQGVMNLEEYFNVRFASNEIWGFNDFDNLKNPYVKSIFISKVQDMRNMKITAEFSCPKIIEDIDIPVFDLIRVLGITLDNAVEAVSGNRNGRIAMNIMNVRGAVKFVISNTVTGPHKPVGKLIKEGYTTKSRHQGLGLGNIRDIRKENGNLFVSYKYEENMFVATITVQQKEG